MDTLSVDTADKPLLSICVPTYKRAALLRSLLRGLAPQVAAQNGRVELIVSDNCPPDDTPDAVAWAQQFGPICYHRNPENIGAARNFIQLAQEMAQGEYCWLMGDDDLVQPDAGPQEWYDWYPFIKVVSMTELAEFFQSRGAHPAAIKQNLSILFADSRYHFWTLLRKRDTPGRAKFRPARYLRYAGYPAFWRMVGLYPLNAFVKPVARPLT